MNRKAVFTLYVMCSALVLLLNDGVSAGKMPNYTGCVYPGADGRLVYISDKEGNVIPDFSHAGYKGGGVLLPYVPVKETVWPVEGDNASHIQHAIDRVSGLPLDVHGFRGAVLLKQGYYALEAPLHISASGVVLRGEGQSDTGTVLIGLGTFDGGYKNRTSAQLIVIGGETCWEENQDSAQRIKDEYVPVGVLDWIDELGMNLDNEQWRWEPFTIRFDRVITCIEGDTITVDAPLTCAIETKWGGGDVVKYTDKGRISHAGIENLRCISEFDCIVRTNEYGNIDRHPYYGEEYYADEKQYWNCISLDTIKNAWVRNVTALHFAGSMVTIGQGAKWVTVQDCVSREPVSRRWGGRRFTFQIQGQLTLVQRCTSDKGRHSFVLGGYQACGPNVFLGCKATIPYSSSEPHYKYVTGALYDSVIAPLTARFWKDISIGWAGANCVFWNCEGQYLIQKPPTAQNYAFGHIGIHATVFNTRYQDLTKEDGHIESWDKHVDPRSLYLKQLKDRLGPQAIKNIGNDNHQ